MTVFSKYWLYILVAAVLGLALSVSIGCSTWEQSADALERWRGQIRREVIVINGQLDIVRDIVREGRADYVALRGRIKEKGIADDYIQSKIERLDKNIIRGWETLVRLEEERQRLIKLLDDQNARVEDFISQLRQTQQVQDNLIKTGTAILAGARELYEEF